MYLTYERRVKCTFVQALSITSITLTCACLLKLSTESLFLASTLLVFAVMLNAC